MSPTIVAIWCRAESFPMQQARLVARAGDKRSREPVSRKPKPFCRRVRTSGGHFSLKECRCEHRRCIETSTLSAPRRLHWSVFVKPQGAQSEHSSSCSAGHSLEVMSTHTVKSWRSGNFASSHQYHSTGFGPVTIQVSSQSQKRSSSNKQIKPRAETL
ncbi:hypothetical protein RRG08_056283 [Elysia crispata]|uniref:Uncharacterized protein n=1 Tax=Elysia crispata TaxID=231223 RepID=A0AAE1AYH9_9GAST|nr:hypothetical protein RRG08_056283 [Elysia crispata]